MTAQHFLAAAAGAAALLISTGCERIEEAGMARNESVSINLDKTEMVHVEIKMGAGELRLDLRGTPKRNMSVRVNGGVGEAIVHLPDTVGIRLEAHGGIGSFNAFGLTRRGSYYQNDLYEKSNQTMDVRISGGIGSIKVYAD